MATPRSYISIKDWSESDRPREKLLQQGSRSLSDAELLAILLGSGTVSMSAVELSRNILSDAGQSLQQLGKKTLKELMVHRGIGEAKAITIAAAMELGRRRAMEAPTQILKITCSQDAFKILQPIMGELPHEEFWVLLLDNSNKVLEKHQISKGGITATHVDHRLLFKQAIAAGAVALIIAHNHPSGTLKPSRQDQDITKKIKTAGDTLDIKVLDHLIITQQNYYSFADNSLL
ncbi:DNA repair protein RadC [Nonlabens sp. Hel1_33_55]|uniref:RadC family protein n=1 Tax=Nonlabens sp. Hel1_33_55 TaxID=1336802 RepID=UPI000875D5FF|nr:DNA repair protein RadC [Nonlabens sp. Hel1_33_55]SCY22193.1 DNA repair protein RadC [Nonlabens sp. Hel1_33_55]